MGPSGGTFPCNDFSLITESLDLSFMKEHFNPDTLITESLDLSFMKEHFNPDNDFRLTKDAVPTLFPAVQSVQRPSQSTPDSCQDVELSYEDITTPERE
ncbi:hypothetical protein QE152_g24643 [Popillia japonica]|uniref:Uncharacterized protein n=1 Tax=Popillia japonica TaxID=7064 RepID=A0AAW1K4W3_POPJA